MTEELLTLFGRVAETIIAIYEREGADAAKAALRAVMGALSAGRSWLGPLEQREDAAADALPHVAVPEPVEQNRTPYDPGDL